MTSRIAALILALLAVLPARADAGDTNLPPTRTRALLAWLKAGTYGTWTPEPAVRQSSTARRPIARQRRTLAWAHPPATVEAVGDLAGSDRRRRLGRPSRR